MEGEAVIEQRQRDPFAVPRFDHDLARRRRAANEQLPATCGIRQADLIDRGLDTPPDGPVIECRCYTRLCLHLVEQPIIPEVHFADVDAIVQRRDEDEERQETAARARAAPRRRHHWDWAPSTMELTSFWSASLRPWVSCGGSYTPSTDSPCCFQIVVPWRRFTISTSTVT